MVGRRLHDWQALKQRQAKASPGRRRRVHVGCLCDDRRVIAAWQSFTRRFPLQPTHTRLIHDACDAHTTPCD
jgi:hypothetical protein